MKSRSVSRGATLILLALMLALVAVAGGGCGEASTTDAAPSDNPSSTSVSSAVGAGGLDTTTTVRQLTEVDLIMDWIPWVLDIPVDVAQAKGFYEQAGLSVHQTIPVEATDVIKFVSTGKSQFGVYYAPDFLMALEEGAGLVSVGAVMSHAPVGMALKPGLTADSPSVLSGKTVSVPLIPSTRASFSSMLEAAGIKADEVEVVDPGFELVAPLLAGTVDAAAFTEFGELVQAEAEGLDLTYLDFRDWGTPDYAFLNLITTQEFAAGHADTVSAFVGATLQGLEYAAAHPEEAVALYVDAHPELDESLLLAQWRAAIPYLAVGAAGKPAGWQDLTAWDSLDEWMMRVGLLGNTLDLGAVVSNDFLEPAP